MLLQSMNVSSLMANFGSFALAAYIFIKRLGHQVSCDLIIKYQTCFMLRGPLVWGMINLHCGFLSLIAERIVATVRQVALLITLCYNISHVSFETRPLL